MAAAVPYYRWFSFWSGTRSLLIGISFLSLLTPLCKLAKWSQSWSRNSILLGLYHDWKYPCDTSMRWQCRFWQLWQARQYLPSHQYKGNAFDHCRHQWTIKRTKPCLDSWWRGGVEHTRNYQNAYFMRAFLCYSIRSKLNFPHLLQSLTNFEHSKFEQAKPKLVSLHICVHTVCVSHVRFLLTVINRVSGGFVVFCEEFLSLGIIRQLYPRCLCGCGPRWSERRAAQWKLRNCDHFVDEKWSTSVQVARRCKFGASFRHTFLCLATAWKWPKCRLMCLHVNMYVLHNIHKIGHMENNFSPWGICGASPLLLLLHRLSASARLLSWRQLVLGSKACWLDLADGFVCSVFLHT